jgi:hypothetical protein
MSVNSVQNGVYCDSNTVSADPPYEKIQEAAEVLVSLHNLVEVSKLDCSPKIKRRKVKKSQEIAKTSAVSQQLLFCFKCGVDEEHTSYMRPGPMGCGTLCNGCGLKWRKHSLISKSTEYANAQFQQCYSQPKAEQSSAFQFYCKRCKRNQPAIWRKSAQHKRVARCSQCLTLRSNQK